MNINSINSENNTSFKGLALMSGSLRGISKFSNIAKMNHITCDTLLIKKGAVEAEDLYLVATSNDVPFLEKIKTVFGKANEMEHNFTNDTLQTKAKTNNIIVNLLQELTGIFTGEFFRFDEVIPVQKFLDLKVSEARKVFDLESLSFIDSSNSSSGLLNFTSK